MLPGQRFLFKVLSILWEVLSQCNYTDIAILVRCLPLVDMLSQCTVRTASAKLALLKAHKVVDK